MQASPNIYVCNSSIHTDEVPVTPVAQGSRELGAWFVAGMLIAAVGLGWTGGSNLHRLLNIDVAMRTPTQKLTVMHRTLNAENMKVSQTDNLATGTSKVLSAGRVSSPAPTVHKRVRLNQKRHISVRMPSYNATPAPPSPIEVSLIAPETRPTTIEGWTIRDVYNGTVTLEGPNGVWKAAPGDKVPGVGHIDSIVLWGSRLIVATTSGLITTR